MSSGTVGPKAPSPADDSEGKENHGGHRCEEHVDQAGPTAVLHQLHVVRNRQPVRIDRDALILGYAGVYSSFLLFAQRAAKKYGISSRDILVEMGRRRTVGGQEDLIETVAIELAQSKAKAEGQSAPD